MAMCAKLSARFSGKMSDFVINTNLPQRAKIVALGEKYSDILDEPLKKLGLLPVYVPDNPCVDARLSGHADLSLFHAGGDRIFLAPYLKNSDFAQFLGKIGFIVEYADINQSEKYPHDAQLNIASIGRAIVYGKKTAYRPIVEYLTIAQKLTVIPINQGYAKCSILAVDERSIITQDRGAAQACAAAGFDVLCIESGYVSLPGFEYGFLGGSGFKLSADILAFTGTLDEHPDKKRILDFLHTRGVKPVYLTERPVFDVGSIIPLTEY